MVMAVAFSMMGMPIIGAMLAATMNQLASGQGLDVGQILEAGAIAYATAGLDAGLGLNSVPLDQIGSDIGAGTASMGEIVQGAVEVVGQSAVSASVNTIAYGGSFGRAMEYGLASNLAAIGSSAIGSGTFGSPIENVVLHTALGCAASAAEGTGCASGAIGGAASALITPLLVSQAGGLSNLTDQQRAIIVAVSTLAGGVTAGALGQNVAGGANAATDEALYNGTNKSDDLNNHPNGTLNPVGGSAFAAACAAGQPCNTQMLGTMLQAQGANADQALTNLQAMAPYAAGTIGVALLGPEALTAAVLGGAYDYAGNAVGYGLGKIGYGPVVDPPSIASSYLTGLASGAMYPFVIADGAIAGMGEYGKLAANAYNAGVAGATAFGAAGMTNQPSPDLSGAMAAGATGLGVWAKAALPGSLGAYANQLFQVLAGPVQNYIQRHTNSGTSK